jgi:hypothetical protein
MKSKVRFQVKWIARAPEVHATVPDANKRLLSGVETEASYFLVDQTGQMYEYAPLRPIRPISSDYLECEPLIKINNEYLSIDEIEKRLNKCS